MDTIDAGLVSWNIEDWLSSFEPKQSFNERRPSTGRKAEILVGEVRELILQSLLQV
jgi:hypothetical protein